jgi:transcriptional regulator with GAF, ATPase, and Fis domain/tetratricopeptide (TPR) repeat protein
LTYKIVYGFTIHKKIVIHYINFFQEQIPLQKKPVHKKSEQALGLSETEKIVSVYLAHATPPVSIDEIISLSGLSTVNALNLMEELKRHHFIQEKEKAGKGIYYPGAIDLKDFIKKNLLPEKLHNILKENIIPFLTGTSVDEKQKIITLAELFFNERVDGDGIAYMKKAADILSRSGNIEKAVQYYDFITDFLSKDSMISDHTEEYLDSIFQRVSRSFFYPMNLNKQLPLLKKAHETARSLRNPVQLAKIKLLLGFSFLQGQTKEATRYINEFWKLVENINDEVLYKQGLLLTSIHTTLMGRFSEAIGYYEKMIGNLEEFGEHEEDLISGLLVALSYVLLGRVSRGIGMINAIRLKAQKLKFDLTVNYADIVETIAMIELRKIPEAENSFKRIWDQAEDGWNNNILGATQFCKAYILCARGDYKGAYENIKMGFMYRDAISVPGLHPYCPWIFECLYLIRSKGFFDDVVNFDLELKRAVSGKNLFLKGAAYRYQALQKIDKKKSEESIINDLKASEKLLKESGSEIELARTRMAMKDFYMARRKQKLAKSYMQKTYAAFSKVSEGLFPNDLLENMPRERKTDLIIEKITSINISLGTVKNQEALLETVMNAAMDFTNATQSAVYKSEENDLRLIASRNIPSSNQALIKLVRETIGAAIKKNKEILIPDEDGSLFGQFNRHGIKSLIGVPIRLSEADHGYFVIGNYYRGEPFPDETLSFMRMFASQLEVGLSNLNAYEEIKRLKERFEDEAILLRREMGIDLPIEQIIGQSQGIKKVIGQIRQVAVTGSLVMVLGETGVGKELVAKAIHNLSGRKEGPFVPVNISTFPHDLVASELFGHEKGAFTGAHEKKKGRFELADGGTIFLDEIGDLSLEMQVKLLRVLQEGSFERLGSSKPIHSDFRVIVATNKNIRQEVEKGTFRQDLYYRLNVFPINVPPLRERRQDIPLLAREFFSMFNKKLDKKITRIPSDEIDKLMTYHWPGNIRELKHFIERAVILSNGYEISFSGFEFENDAKNLNDHGKIALLSDVERDHIEKTLKNTYWKISGPYGAATLLGLPTSTLRHRMKLLGISKKSLNL